MYVKNFSLFLTQKHIHLRIKFHQMSRFAIRSLIIALLFILHAGCGAGQNSSKIEKIIGCWTDSYEEYNSGSEPSIYRPCDFKNFPPSRFRAYFELRADGSCTYLMLAPNDAHKSREGTWNYDKNSKELTIRNASRNIEKQYVLVNISDNLLTIKM